MAQSPSATSTQYSIMYNFDTMQVAGTLIHIQTESGEELVTFAPAKEFQSVVISSPQIANGATYTVFTGGSPSGNAVDGLYSGSAYLGGTQVASFTIASIVTTAGAVGGFGPGGFGPAGGGPGGGGQPPQP